MPASGLAPNPLTLPENLTVRTAADVKEILLHALNAHAAVDLDIPVQAAIDLSFIQTVEAARLYAGKCEKKLSLSRAADGVLLAVLNRGGIVEGMDLHDKQFWLHQGETQ